MMDLSCMNGEINFIFLQVNKKWLQHRKSPLLQYEMRNFTLLFHIDIFIIYLCEATLNGLLSS